MSISLYMDVHVKRAITNGLRHRSVDVITAQEDGAATLTDTDLLDRATALRRVLVSQDEDLLAEAHKRQQKGELFAGLVYSHQMTAIGVLISDLELLTKACDPADLVNCVVYLPF
jgi:predicted nuclease of predicted toxin-antitoxin system